LMKPGFDTDDQKSISIWSFYVGIYTFLQQKLDKGKIIPAHYELEWCIFMGRQ
jgi:hypothetical protein